MTLLQIIYEVWCKGLLASQLTRKGNWQGAVRLISK